MAAGVCGARGRPMPEGVNGSLALPITAAGVCGAIRLGGISTSFDPELLEDMGGATLAFLGRAGVCGTIMETGRAGVIGGAMLPLDRNGVCGTAACEETVGAGVSGIAVCDMSCSLATAAAFVVTIGVLGLANALGRLIELC